MADDVTRYVPIARRRELVDQAGGKCANPGCPSTLLEFHHIKEWAVFKSHDTGHMIALCPNCHTSAHRGDLMITDEQLYEWKKIGRTKRRASQLYVEPGDSQVLIAGAIQHKARRGRLNLIRETGGADISFRVVNGGFMQVSLAIHTADGTEVLRAVDNSIRVQAEGSELEFNSIAGRVRLTAPADSRYVPDFVRERMELMEDPFVSNGRFVILDLEVLRPGVIRLNGCWKVGRGWLVITRKAINLITETGAISLRGSECGGTIVDHEMDDSAGGFLNGLAEWHLGSKRDVVFTPARK